MERNPFEEEKVRKRSLILCRLRIFCERKLTQNLCCSDLQENNENIENTSHMITHTTTAAVRYECCVRRCVCVVNVESCVRSSHFHGSYRLGGRKAAQFHVNSAGEQRPKFHVFAVLWSRGYCMALALRRFRG